MKPATNRQLTEQAFVVERAGNGFIVRPNRSWWRSETDSPYPVDDVLVFTDYAAFCAWMEPWFPKAAS